MLNSALSVNEQGILIHEHIDFGTLKIVSLSEDKQVGILFKCMPLIDFNEWDFGDNDDCFNDSDDY